MTTPAANLLIRNEHVVTENLLALRVLPGGCELGIERDPLRVAMFLDRNTARLLATHLLAIADGTPKAP